jgi:hypothetical protein
LGDDPPHTVGDQGEVAPPGRADLAEKDDGRCRRACEEAATRPTEAMAGRSVRAGGSCYRATFGECRLEDLLSAVTTRSDGRAPPSSRRAGGLAGPGGAGEDDGLAGAHRGPQEALAAGLSMSLATRSSRVRKATPVNLRMFTITWPSRPTSPCTMWRRDPLSSWASWRPLRGVELAVRSGGVVQDLGEGPHHVVVVVETDLIEVDRRACVVA